MIRLEKVLKTSLQDGLKMSWRRLQNVLKTFLLDVLETFWRRLKNVLARRLWRCLKDVLKTSSRFLEDVFARSFENVLKTFWRRLENVLKTSWRHMTKMNILVLIKASWRRLLKTKAKDVFIKTNVCWEISLDRSNIIFLSLIVFKWFTKTYGPVLEK